MKQTAAVITAVTFYLGSLFAIDSAIANDHDRDDNNRKPIKMLFHNIVIFMSIETLLNIPKSITIDS